MLKGSFIASSSLAWPNTPGILQIISAGYNDITSGAYNLLSMVAEKGQAAELRAEGKSQRGQSKG